MSCSICLENIEPTDKQIQIPECPHVFHSKCFCDYIEKQVPREVTCPLCRKLVIKATEVELSQVPPQRVHAIIAVQQPPDDELITNHMRIRVCTTILYMLIAFFVFASLNSLWYNPHTDPDGPKMDYNGHYKI